MKRLSDEQIERLSPESKAKYERDLKKVNRNRKILFSFGGTLVTLLIVFILSITVLFNVTSIKVVEAGKIYSADQIIMASGLDVGDNMIRTDFEAAESRIEQNLPYIRVAKITKKITGQVVISVSDTVESVIIDFGTGEYLVTDSDGKILRKLSEYPEDCKLMRIKTLSKADGAIGTVFGFSIKEEDENYKAIKSGLEKVGLFGKITEIDVRDSNSLKAVYENRLRLMIGTTENLETKLKGAAETIEIENKTDPTAIAEVNLTIPKKVFVNPLTSLDPPEETNEDEPADAGEQEPATQPDVTTDSAQEPTTDGETTQPSSDETTTGNATQADQQTTSTTTQSAQ